jgi:uncharacterized protein involved in outer membrane biogenesis
MSGNMGQASLRIKMLKIAIGGLALIVLGAVFLWARWPFTRKQVVHRLEEASQSKVTYEGFHGTYFPRPGCVLEHVTFHLSTSSGTPPLIAIGRLRIESSFLGLFSQHVKRILVEGMHISIPSQGSGEHFKTPQRSSIVIDQLTADGAILEFASQDPGKKPLTFGFRKFTLAAIGGRGPASFQADFSIPRPSGEIVAKGKFGPWAADDVGKTPVSGQYSLRRTDLGTFGGIAGVLSSVGEFGGTLSHIGVRGTSETPDFTVKSSAHQLQLRTDFQAVVDGTTGDTLLQAVTAKFWRTTVSAGGSVAADAKQQGKTARIDLAADNARIEDLLKLFARSERAPMSGPVSFSAKVALPPEERPFLDKLYLEGDFGIDRGTFSKKDTREAVNSLSKGARGLKDHVEKERDQDPETVLSALKGHVVLKNGTAHFSNLAFSVPGAFAQLNGTYNLVSEQIDLHGTLTTDSRLSNTTHGVKALMLKVLDPFFKKHHQAGYAAPVKITGTYAHPAFGLDLGDRKTHKPAEAANRTISRNSGNELSKR